MSLTGESCRLLARVMLMAVSIHCYAVRVCAAAEPGAEVSAPKAGDLRIAADRFDQGRDAFKSGAFGEAAEHFEAADARAPSLSALTLAMRSRAEAGQYAKALTLAELLIARHGDGAEAIEQAQSLILAHTPALGRLDITCEPDCDLVVDRKLIHGGAQGTFRVYVETGKHDVTANFEGERYAEGQVTVDVGQSAGLALSAPKPVVETVEPPPVKVQPPQQPVLSTAGAKGWSPIWFWIGVGTTAAVGAVTIWSGVDTLTNPGIEEVRDKCKDTDCALYREGQSKELRTNLLLSGTVVLAVATAATGIFATDFRGVPNGSTRGSSQSSVRLIANLGTGKSAFLGAEGRF